MKVNETINITFLGNKNLRVLLKETECFWFSNSRSKRIEDITNKKIENKVNIWKRGKSINPLGIPKKKSRTEKITDKIIKKLKITIKKEDTNDVNKILFPLYFLICTWFQSIFYEWKVYDSKKKKE